MAGADPGAWNRYAPGDARGALPPFDGVRYGPDVGGEGELRLLGNVSGRRVLDLGCGGGQNLVALAAAGAHAIGLDSSPEQLAATKRLSEHQGVRVEVHQGDLADLAFLRAESVDLAFSAYGLSRVGDLNRLFRQVHRVLRQGAPFVFSLEHPLSSVLQGPPSGPATVGLSYFDPGQTVPFRHTLGDLFSGLARAKFRVDALVEPEPSEGPRSPWWREVWALVPPTLVVRGRKEGI